MHDDINSGDEFSLYAPVGDFFIVHRDKPVVLISAVVGITPMQAMLENLGDQNYQENVYYLYACENSEKHSFAPRTHEIIIGNSISDSNMKKSNLQNIYHGFMDFTKFNLPIDNGDFYLCRPIGLVRT